MVGLPAVNGLRPRSAIDELLLGLRVEVIEADVGEKRGPPTNREFEEGAQRTPLRRASLHLAPLAP